MGPKRTPPERAGDGPRAHRDLPAPTPSFRRRSWREYQRALDPLAPPRLLPTRPPPQPPA